jgi:mono/diheme cytochrome c family protein
MGDIVGLHDKAAERIVRREFPDLEEAKQVASNYTIDQIIELGEKGFRDPASITREEFDAVAAYLRVKFESSRPQSQ